MNKTVEMILVCLVLFVMTGVLAYITETILFRHSGRIGSHESLWEYFRKIDQKNGNIAAFWWAVIWIIWMIIRAVIAYLVW